MDCVLFQSQTFYELVLLFPPFRQYKIAHPLSHELLKDNGEGVAFVELSPCAKGKDNGPINSFLLRQHFSEYFLLLLYRQPMCPFLCYH